MCHKLSFFTPITVFPLIVALAIINFGGNLRKNIDRIKILLYVTSVCEGKIYLIEVRSCKLNYLSLIPVRANFPSPSGYILSIVVEYLNSDNNPRRAYIAIVFFKERSWYYGTITLL